MVRARREAGMQNPKVTVIGEALIDLVPGEAPLAYARLPGEARTTWPSAWPGWDRTRR